jgi:hypothetical protein
MRITDVEGRTCRRRHPHRAVRLKAPPLRRERGSRIVSAWTTKRDEGPRVLFPWGRGRRLRRALWRGGRARRDRPPLGAGGGSCPASFRDYERVVILSSLSGTVVARDEFLPVWADVEAAMELDLLGRRGQGGVEGEELDDQALPAMRSHELGRRRVLLGDRVGVSARDAAQAHGPMHGLDLSPHDEVLLRGPVPERALRVAASAVGGGTRVRIRRQDQPQRCGGSPVAEPTCEEFADVAREQVGRLGRREVAAARHRRPAADVV